MTDAVRIGGAPLPGVRRRIIVPVKCIGPSWGTLIRDSVRAELKCLLERRAEFEANHAGERQLLPRAAGDDEVVLKREVVLARNEVMGELAAGARQLQNFLVGLHHMEL